MPWGAGRLVASGMWKEPYDLLEVAKSFFHEDEPGSAGAGAGAAASACETDRLRRSGALPWCELSLVKRPYVDDSAFSACRSTSPTQSARCAKREGGGGGGCGR